MTILLHKVIRKVTTKGGSKIPKNITTWFMDDPISQYILKLSQPFFRFMMTGH